MATRKPKPTELDRLSTWSLTWRIGVAALMGAATATQFTRAFDVLCPPTGWGAFLTFAMVGVISWLIPGMIALVIQRHREEMRQR
jgi:hypothetical protein